MQLTSHTDYALRTLLFLGMHPDRLATVAEVSDYYQISRNHMMKVVHQLGQHGFIQTIRGKAGGIRLARDPGSINIADVVNAMEPHMNIQECFSAETNTCPLLRTCKLKHLLYEGRDAFLSTLAQKTLADIL